MEKDPESLDTKLKVEKKKGRPNLGGPAKASKRYYQKIADISNTRTLLRRSYQNAKRLLDLDTTLNTAKERLTTKTAKELSVAYRQCTGQPLASVDFVNEGYTVATVLMRKANYCDGPKNNDKRNDWWEPLTLAMDDMYRVHNEFTQEQMVAFQKEASSLFPSDLPSQLINQDSQPTIKSPTSAPGLAESESPAVMDSAQQDSPTRKLESVSTDLTLDFPSSGEPLPTETLPMDEENLRAISKKLTDLARLQELESAAAAVAASASSPASALTTHDSVFDTMTLSTNPPPPATHLLDDSGSTANDAIVTPSESTTSSQPAFNVWIHRKPKYRKKLLVSFFYYCLAHASSLDPVHPSFATTQPSPHPPLLADPAAVLSADALIPLPTPELASNDRLEPSSDAQLE